MSAVHGGAGAGGFQERRRAQERAPGFAGRFRGRRRSEGRARSDEGAALVEFALLAPFLLVLLFGIIDFGMMLNDYQSLRQGVRDGARAATVADYGSSCGPSTGARLACLVRARVGLESSGATPGVAPFVTRVMIIAPPVYQVGQPVTVCAVTAARSLSGFPVIADLLGNKALRSKITMRIEKLTSTPITSYSADTDPSPPAGGPWSWCTAT